MTKKQLSEMTDEALERIGAKRSTSRMTLLPEDYAYRILEGQVMVFFRSGHWWIYHKVGNFRKLSEIPTTPGTKAFARIKLPLGTPEPI